jgi:hypothetical protein
VGLHAVITGCAKVSQHHLETKFPIEQPFAELAVKIAGLWRIRADS